MPSRFSDEHLIVLRALENDGLTRDDVHLVEMPPPLEVGLLDEPIEFEEHVGTRFAAGTMGVTAWKYEPGARVAE